MDKLRQAIIILEEAAKEIEAGEPLHPVYDRRDQVAWGIRKAKKKIKQIREDIIFYKKLKEEINEYKKTFENEFASHIQVLTLEENTSYSLYKNYTKKEPDIV